MLIHLSAWQRGEPPKTTEMCTKATTSFMIFGGFREAGCPKHECLICREKLSNVATALGDLKRHVETKHPSFVSKDAEYVK